MPTNRRQKEKKQQLIDELFKEREPPPSKEQAQNTATSTAHKEEEQTVIDDIYAVYILQRVVQETKRVCKLADPNEAIGVLLGYKFSYKGQKYVKVVDWVTGRAYQSRAFAEFTPEGVQQYTSIIQEKYGDGETRPRIVGIFHSHPFGTNPSFSSTDYRTFLNFPYDADYNVFVLIDPRTNYYKSYIVTTEEGSQEKTLKEVDWVEYTAK